jgi:hypothetical protein
MWIKCEANKHISGGTKLDIMQKLDQLSALLRDLAPVFMKYKTDLMKQGFSEEEALKLVIQAQEIILNK